MHRPKGAERLTHQVQVRFRPGDMDLVGRAADADGLRISQWVRSAAVAKARRWERDWADGPDVSVDEDA